MVKKLLLTGLVCLLAMPALAKNERPVAEGMRARAEALQSRLELTAPIEILRRIPVEALPPHIRQLYEELERIQPGFQAAPGKCGHTMINKAVSAGHLEQVVQTHEGWDPTAGSWQYTDRGTLTLDALGQMTEDYWEIWKNGGWQDNSKITWTWDAFGNIIESIFQFDNTGTGVLVNSSKGVATVDGNGYVTQENYYNWSGSAWVNSTQYLYTNDANGNPTMEIYQYWVGSSWVTSNRNSNLYDANGNLIEQVTEIWNGSAWQNQFHYTAAYDASGNMSWEIYQHWDGAMWVNDAKYTYTYDASGNNTVSLSQTWNGSDWENDWRDSWTYNAQNLETQYLWENWNVTAWENNYRETYTYPAAKTASLGGYDKASYILAVEWKMNAWENSWQMNRTFDAFGLPHVEIYQDWDETASSMGHAATAMLGNWVNGSKYTYTRTYTGVEDDEPVLPETFMLSNYPNPFNPETTIRFSLPEALEVSVQVYDINGALVRTLASEARYGAGSHRLVWDGRDNTGQIAASGVYLYRLVSEKFTESRRCVLMK